MNEKHGREAEASDDLLFSPMRNPTAPGGEMLDERSPDSVLFDVRTLSTTQEPKASARAGTAVRAGTGATPPEPEEEASGLIDVKKVLAVEPAEAPIRSPVVDRLTPSVAEAALPEPQTNDRVRTMLLLASIVTALVVGGLFLVKAMS